MGKKGKQGAVDTSVDFAVSSGKKKKKKKDDKHSANPKNNNSNSKQPAGSNRRHRSGGKGGAKEEKKKDDLGFDFDLWGKGVGKKKLKTLYNGVVKSRKDRMVGDIVVKEWQRLPKQLIHEWTQKQKRPKPRFVRAKSNTPGEFTVRVILPDPKKADKDINLCPEQSYPSKKDAEHYAALLALHHVGPSIPHERKLPEPYAAAWLSLSSDEPEVTPKSFFSSTAQRKEAERARQTKMSQRKAKQDMRELQKHKIFASVTMSDRNRMIVENILKESPLHEDFPESLPAALQKRHQQALSKVAAQLKQMGFSAKDATTGSTRAVQMYIREQETSPDEAALDVTRAVLDALYWLLLHMPEHRLPAQFNPQGKQLKFVAGASSEQKASQPPASSSASSSSAAASAGAPPASKAAAADVRHCMRLGFPPHVVQHYAREDPSSSREHLLVRLYGDLYQAAVPSVFEEKKAAVDATELQELLEEEEETLSAIFEKDYRKVSAHAISVALTAAAPPNSAQQKAKGKNRDSRVIMQVYSPPSDVAPDWPQYPNGLPIFSFTVNGTAMPPGAHQIAVQQVAKFIVSQQLLGEPYLFELCEHIKDEWHSMLQHDLVAVPSWSSLLQASLRGPSSGPAAQSMGGKRGRRQYNQNSKRLQNDPKVNRQLQDEEKEKASKKGFAAMKRQRDSLPVASFRDRIIELVNSNQVLVVSGETGSGKSTQIPQFLLDHMIAHDKGSQCRIICTQPRRISAVGLAERVADERLEKVGDTVGYRIRLKSAVSHRTRLEFVTTGILLRMLTGSDRLEGVSHIVVDEVHERSVDIDFLLLILRSLVKSSPNLKLVLMSATLDAAMFSAYFGKCPIVAMKGRTFPVKEYFLEDVVSALHKRNFVSIDDPVLWSGGRQRLEKEELDERIHQLKSMYPQMHHKLLETLALMRTDRINYELIACLVFYLLTTTKKGGILVFLPGLADIRAVCDRVSRGLARHDLSADSLWIIPLHSSLSTSNQKRVFQSTPPGVRKLVVSTNIAETSITVNDVIYVIDSGKLKETQYDPHRKMSMLVETWVSKASATQRKGRAGRVQKGVCYRVFPRWQWNDLAAQQEPEIRRTALEHVCLQLKLLARQSKKKRKKPVPLSKMFASAIEPPAAAAVQSAVKTLKDLSAFTPDEALTPLGVHLARLPVGNVRIGKLLIYGAILGCTTPAVTVAAMLSQRSPLMSNNDNRQEAAEKHSQFRVPFSDHLTLMNIFNKYQNVKDSSGRWKAVEFCKENFLSWRTLDTAEGLVRQYTDSLADIGLLPARRKKRSSGRGGSNSGGSNGVADEHSDKTAIVLAVITAGLYPNVIKVKHPQELYTPVLNGAVPKPHNPKDLKFYTKDTGGRVFIHPASVNFSNSKYQSPWLVYLQMMETRRVYVYDCSMVSPYSLLLLGGAIGIEPHNGLISVDGWIKFRAVARVAVLVHGLRLELDALLREKISNPTLDLSDSPVVQAILLLLTRSGFDRTL